MTWSQNIIQLLDDHHLVVLSDNPQARSQFAQTLAESLGLIAQTEVVMIDGRSATDLPSFCRQLESHLSGAGTSPSPQTSDRWWRDIHSVIEILRGAGGGLKRRYFIWPDADSMLEADVELFSSVVNAIFGVAAESEHINLDPVIVQRVVFIGGSKLGAYAEDTSGQFCKWLEDEENSPFWEVMSVVDKPAVITYRIDG